MLALFGVGGLGYSVLVVIALWLGLGSGLHAQAVGPIPQLPAVLASSGGLKVECLAGCSGGGGGGTVTQGPSGSDPWKVTFGTPQHVIVDSASLGTVAVSGTFWQTTQPVSLTSLPALSAGSAVIGHVIADSGSTTTVTGNVTAVQPTAANLNMTEASAAASKTDLDTLVTNTTSIATAARQDTGNTSLATLAALLQSVIETVGQTATLTDMGVAGNDRLNITRAIRTDTSGVLLVSAVNTGLAGAAPRRLLLPCNALRRANCQ